MTVICPVCLKNDTQKHPVYGVLPCDSCQTKRRSQSRPTKQVEFVGDSIKNGRQEYAKSIIQPYRSGELSREYLELYGTKNISVSPKQIKQAKYVWRDTYSANVDLAKTK